MITSSCSPFYTYTFALVVCLISEVEESHVNVMQQNCLGYFWIFWIVHDISQYFSIFSDSFNLNSNYPEISGSTSSFLAIPLPHAGPGFKLQQLDPAPHFWGIWTFWTIDLWWFMMIYDYSLWLIMIYDYLWWFMMLYDLWLFIMTYDDLWWFMTTYDDLWWFMMTYDDLLWKFHTAKSLAERAWR
jgi:hypothetical protein